MYKPKTVDFESDIGIFRMLAGMPMQVNLVARFMAENGDDYNSSAGQSFLIVEGYMYDFIPSGDSDMAEYIQARANLNLRERYKAFMLIVQTKRGDLIYQAYEATRDRLTAETAQDGDKKKPTSTKQKKA